MGKSKYFISYVHEKGYGNGIIDNFEIEEDSIRELAKMVEEKANFKNVCILNFVRLGD